MVHKWVPLKWLPLSKYLRLPSLQHKHTLLNSQLTQLAIPLKELSSLDTEYPQRRNQVMEVNHLLRLAMCRRHR